MGIGGGSGGGEVRKLKKEDLRRLWDQVKREWQSHIVASGGGSRVANASVGPAPSLKAKVVAFLAHQNT